MNEVETAIRAGRAHFQQTLGILPDPIRAMMEHAPDAFAGYLRFREGVYRDRPDAALLHKCREGFIS